MPCRITGDIPFGSSHSSGFSDTAGLVARRGVAEFRPMRKCPGFRATWSHAHDPEGVMQRRIQTNEQASPLCTFPTAPCWLCHVVFKLDRSYSSRPGLLLLGSCRQTSKLWEFCSVGPRWSARERRSPKKYLFRFEVCLR